jgi:hypothetical protein
MREAERSGKRDSFHRTAGGGRRVDIFRQKVLENHNAPVQTARPLWDRRKEYWEA